MQGRGNFPSPLHASGRNFSLTQTAGNGTIAARVGFAWAMVISDTLAVNEVAVLEITKAGTGVALPEGLVQLTVEYA